MRISALIPPIRKKPRLPAPFNLLRLLIAISPFVLLIFWAIAYLRSVWILVLAPGVPIEASWSSPGGIVRFRADSYVVDLNSGITRFRRASVLLPNGKTLASVETLSLVGLNPLKIADSSVRVKIDRAELNIVRKTDGSLQLEDLLPKGPSKPTPFPFSVAIASLKVHYEDRSSEATAGDPWIQDGVVTELNVAGSGRDTVGAANVQAPNIGAAQVAFRTGDLGQVGVQVRSDGLELASVLNRVFTKAQRKQFGPYFPDQVGRLHMSGPATVVLANKQAPAFTARVDGEMSNATWPKTLPPLRSAKVSGLLSDSGAQGTVVFASSGARGRLTGNISWRKGIIAKARTEASVTNVADLPPQLRKYVPHGVGAKGVDLKGGLVYQGGLLSIANRMYADRLVANADTVANASADVFVTLPKAGPNIVVGLDAAHFGITPLRGRLEFKPGQSVPGHAAGPLAVNGAVEANTTEVTQLLHRFTGWNPDRLGVFDGKVRAVALLGGNLHVPTGRFQTLAVGGFTLPKQKRLAIDEAFARGSFTGLVVNFNRITARTDGGAVIGLGQLDVAKHAIDFTLDGRGLDLRQLSPDVTGLASVAGRIKGPWQGPSFAGEAEAYDAVIRGEEVALVRSDIEADPQKIVASDLQAVAGSAVAEGWLSLNLKDQGISGELSAPELQLADFLGPNYDGVVNLKTQAIAGTLQDPEIVARALASNMILGNVPATLGIATVKLKGHDLGVSGGGLALLGGSATFAGDYDLSKEAGAFNVTATNIGLDPTLSAIGGNSETRLAGRVGGTAAIHIKKNLVDGEAKGQFAAVELNGSELGSGVWSVTGNAPLEAVVEAAHQPRAEPIQPDAALLPSFAVSTEPSFMDRLTKHLELKGSAQLGYKTTFLSLEDASYKAADRSISGELLASDVSIKQAFSAALPYLSDLPDDVRERLSSADGNVVTNVVASGSLDHPHLEVTKLDAEAIQLNGIQLGGLQASGGLSDKDWHITHLAYADGEAQANLSGSYVEGGNVKGDGELSNLDLDKLTRAWPAVPHLAGLASASISVNGTAKSPVIRGSLNEVGIQAATGFDVFGLNLDSIVVRDGLASAEGNVNGVGFVGTLTASAPIRYPLDHVGDTPLTAKLTLAPRELKGIEGLPPTLDPARLDASLSGGLDASGTIANPVVTGDLLVEAKRLGFRVSNGPKATDWLALKTEITNASASVHLDHELLTLKVQAQSSAGGSVAGGGTAKFPPLKELLANANRAESTSAGERILDTVLDTSLTFSAFRVDENNRTISARGTLGGDLKLNGPLATPTVSGALTLDQASSNLPNLVAGEGTASTLYVDPKFNLQVKLASEAKITSSLATFSVTGGMRLNGSLSQPDARAGLTLTGGNLQLPGGKVILSPGGRITGTYNVEPDGVARAHMNVDIVGESHVVAVRSIDEVDPYDVTLNIRGDLLAPDDVDFQTTSIPPGLDKTEILGLLGRTDILTAFGANDPISNGRDRLQNAITSYALPSLVSPLTNGLASGLKLDYLSLQFNALNQTIVFAGKTLGHGFSIYAQRQVSPATPGYPALFDYRLTYRPPSSRIVPRQVSFFVGTDQERPWKIGVDYSFRF